MNIILVAVLAIITFEFGLEMLLNYLNISSLSASLPSELEGLYEADAYKKSQDYTKAKTVLGWEPKVKFEELVKIMMEHDIKNINSI